MAFRVGEGELPEWEKRLKAAGYPVWWAKWPKGKSLYTQDPAGNLVELALARVWGLDP